MRNKATNNLEAIAERIRDFFAAKDMAREEVIRRCREVIRYSANAIRAVHRQDEGEAKYLLESAHNSLQMITHAVPKEHNDLLHSGLIHDAQKEFAEASITLALVAGDTIPTPETTGVTYAAYLNGMGEAVGELRRYLLDSMRRNDLSRCEKLLATMDEIYSILVTMDFPDAITFGLRRTTDAVRGILERTRGDLTLILRQKALEDKLKSK
ncbi:MAG: haloacid dehalogenase [Chloroflexi bacterium]|nr:haloacid dehalogenase [Chloroflexota bacterium]MBM3174431.1 haloacid dehalogenase [Chloroflexota bacterium]MBM4449617.1 haloacid dehalogenase [Chloroflexota bacterium]